MEKKLTDYYLGLDIGTDSIGYAVTDPEYRLQKYRGEPMWGVHLFEAAGQSAERRAFRTARRRIDRRQQRVLLTQEIFAAEIAKVDAGFYTRIRESALYAEDSTLGTTKLFTGPYTDHEYHKEYPTIHHLICKLMDPEGAYDVRLVYLAVAYLMAHRGHFLKEVDKNNIDAVLDFSGIYREFMEFFPENGFEAPWECEESAFEMVLKEPQKVKTKEKAFLDLLFGGKKPKKQAGDTFDRGSIITLLCGGKESLKKLYCRDDLDELGSVSLAGKEEELEQVIGELGDDAKLLILLKNLYDWSVLTDLLRGKNSISQAKVETYVQHERDLKYLKGFIRTYYPEKYNEIFRSGRKGLANYVAYSYHMKAVADKEKREIKKASKEEFCAYIKRTAKDCAVAAEDQVAYDDMMERLDRNSFMPKQVSTDNRVIPYQLYWVELKKILENAAKYLPFLTVTGDDGMTPAEKLLSVFEFRIPYFVGPLRRDNSAFAWIERKADGKIYPWNFEQMVDLDASEQAFIKRMTGTCTYLPGEKVLPKCSFLYQEFEVLNELNNLCVDGMKVPVSVKQDIVEQLFKNLKKVTVKHIKDYLHSIGIEGELSGLDVSIKSSLSSYHAFKRLLESNTLTQSQVESIIEHFTYTESKARAARWLEREYGFLTRADLRYLSNLKFKDFGRLSRRFLTGVYDVDPSTGEAFSVIEAMRNTSENLMQLLSDKYGYKAQIDAEQVAYYRENPKTLNERFQEMYIPNAVKRPIHRALDIVRDVQKVCGDPQKIFVEMARGGLPEQKGKRTLSRRAKILEFYKHFPKEEVRLLSEQLAGKEDRELQSDALYLYFTQLGRCMYSGESVDIHELKSAKYNVDHIYPRSKVKDDSMDNRVLVLSSINGDKSDVYPIEGEIRRKMAPFWQELHHKGLISNEKWNRLKRATPFTEEEKWGFINRQLVETRQSTKAVAILLGEMFPETEIVYVKAGLVSEFRQEFDLPKSRTVNDLHHAKDAYLNIAVGNVYHSCFSKRWFQVDSEYSIKAKTLFSRTRKCDGQVVWNGDDSLALVRKTMDKNAAHLTRYAFCRHGGFFDQQPVKAQENDALFPRKANLPVERYGGYQKSTASFFSLVRYETGRKSDVMVMPVELLCADKFLEDPVFAERYAKETIGRIANKSVEKIEFPFGMRILKVNTMFSFDGFLACLGGKHSGGKRLTMYPMMTFSTNGKTTGYIKRLERFAEKYKESAMLTVQEKYDKITRVENERLYDLYTEKLRVFPHVIFWGKYVDTLVNGKDGFMRMSTESQVESLLNIGQIFKSNRSGTCDLTSVNGSKGSCSCLVSANLSNWKEKYHEVYLIDSSASGLFQHKSGNLLNLL